MSVERPRQFEPSGIETFRKWLRSARLNPNAAVPWELLRDNKLTSPIDTEIELDRPGFATKRKAALYLRDKLAPLPASVVLRNAGLRTWLSLYYFDDICPVDSRGERSVGNDYRYVYEVDQALYHYRHLLRISYEILRRAPDHNRLFLRSPVDQLGVAEKVMRNLYLTRVEAIFEVMDRLYFDVNTGRAKRGLTTKPTAPGNLIRRLPRRIQQLQRTHDLNVVDADRLLELLGPEFTRFANPPVLPGMR